MRRGGPQWLLHHLFHFSHNLTPEMNLVFSERKKAKCHLGCDPLPMRIGHGRHSLLTCQQLSFGNGSTNKADDDMSSSPGSLPRCLDFRILSGQFSQQVNKGLKYNRNTSQAFYMYALNKVFFFSWHLFYIVNTIFYGLIYSFSSNAI